MVLCLIASAVKTEKTVVGRPATGCSIEHLHAEVCACLWQSVLLTCQNFVQRFAGLLWDAIGCHYSCNLGFPGERTLSQTLTAPALACRSFILLANKIYNSVHAS